MVEYPELKGIHRDSKAWLCSGHPPQLLGAGTGSSPPMDAKFCVLTHEAAAAPHLPRGHITGKIWMFFHLGYSKPAVVLLQKADLTKPGGNLFQQSEGGGRGRHKGMKTSGFCLILMFGAAPACAHQSPP